MESLTTSAHHRRYTAEGVIHRIGSHLELLRTHPSMGKPTPESAQESVRELVVAPYRIFYRPRQDCIEVLAIMHGRRQYPDSLTDHGEG